MLATGGGVPVIILWLLGVVGAGFGRRPGEAGGDRPPAHAHLLLVRRRSRRLRRRSGRSAAGTTLETQSSTSLECGRSRSSTRRHTPSTSSDFSRPTPAYTPATPSLSGTRRAGDRVAHISLLTELDPPRITSMSSASCRRTPGSIPATPFRSGTRRRHDCLDKRPRGVGHVPLLADCPGPIRRRRRCIGPGRQMFGTAARRPGHRASATSAPSRFPRSASATSTSSPIPGTSRSSCSGRWSSSARSATCRKVGGSLSGRSRLRHSLSAPSTRATRLS